MRKYLAILALLASLATSSSTTQKFHHWFPGHKQHFSEVIDSQVCAKELHNYWTVNRTECWTTCSCVVDCLLDNTSESIKMNMAAASILLGLTPSILALMGPSVAEVSTLSARFPLLAILVGMASPAVNPLQLFVGVLPSTEVLAGSTSLVIKAWHGWWTRQPSTTKMLVRFAEFLVVGAMLANTIHVSIHLDLRSVSAWRCGQMYMPLIWSLLSIAVHILGIIAVRFRQPTSSYTAIDPEFVTPDQTTQPFLGILRRRTRGTFTQTMEWKPLVRGQDSALGEFFFWLTSMAGIIHMIFGVLVFSGLIFVAATDALPVLIRYAISAGVCQSVLRVELALMRLDLESDGSNDEGGRSADEEEK